MQKHCYACREACRDTQNRVSTEFHRHGIPRNFLTSEVISVQFRRNSAKFRGIPRNFAGIAPEITSVFRGMPKCHFRGHPNSDQHWLVSHLVRVPNSRSGGHDFESLCGKNSVHWLKVERRLVLGSGLSTVVTPTWSHDHVSLSGCIILAAWHITGRLACLADSLARCHFSTSKCRTNAVLEGAM